MADKQEMNKVVLVVEKHKKYEKLPKSELLKLLEGTIPEEELSKLSLNELINRVFINNSTPEEQAIYETYCAHIYLSSIGMIQSSLVGFKDLTSKISSEYEEKAKSRKKITRCEDRIKEASRALWDFPYVRFSVEHGQMAKSEKECGSARAELGIRTYYITEEIEKLESKRLKTIMTKKRLERLSIELDSTTQELQAKIDKKYSIFIADKNKLEATIAYFFYEFMKDGNFKNSVMLSINYLYEATYPTRETYDGLEAIDSKALSSTPKEELFGYFKKYITDNVENVLDLDEKKLYELFNSFAFAYYQSIIAKEGYNVIRRDNAIKTLFGQQEQLVSQLDLDPIPLILRDEEEKDTGTTVKALKTGK